MTPSTINDTKHLFVSFRFVHPVVSVRKHKVSSVFWHSVDRASWYTLITKAKAMHYF